MSFAFFQKHWAVEPIAEHINFWNPFKKYRPQAGQSEVPYDPERYTIKMVDAFVMPNCYDDKAIEREWETARLHWNGPGPKQRPLNPMHEFEQGKFHDSIFEFLHTLQIRKPTPIQQFVIPYILENGPRCNYRISAKNGSGKTFAYLLPILDLIVRHAVMAETADFETRTSKSCPFAVIVMPNPQLCVQFKNLLDHFRSMVCKRLGICMLLPGARLRLTDDRLPGCKIVIGTLGMISSHFFPPPNQEVFFRTTRLKYVVIDDLSDNLRVEAAELFKVCRTLSCGLIVVDSDLPTPAGSFENMLGTQSYELVMNSHFHLSNIQHLLVEVEAEEKTVALLDVLWNSIYGAKYTPKVMVFVDTYTIAKDLEAIIMRKSVQRAKTDSKTVHACLLSKEVPDEIRMENIKEFRKWKSKYDVMLVVGEHAIRGLNFPDLGVVVHYDLPRSQEAYLRQVGRCGRLNAKHRVVDFVDPNEDENKLEYLRQLWLPIEQSRASELSTNNACLTADPYVTAAEF